MGCISSKSSNDEQPSNHEIDPNHHSVNNASEFMVPKHDDILTIDADEKEHGSRQWSLEENKLTIERCSSFHTVKEYDELLQRINSSKDDGELVSVPETNLDQSIKKDSEDETGMIKEKKTEDTEFQTVASLRQWLHSPCVADTDEEANANAATDYLTPKYAFGFYDDNNNNTETPGENLVLVETGKKQEDETIIDLVAAFDQYMQQLQIDEDNILKHIHNIVD